MYDRVLLAYDGSREARTALREGALLARKFACKVFLLCVVSEGAGVQIGEAALPGAVALTRETYQALFDDALEKLTQLGFKPEGKMVYGEPATEIAAYAREVNADLVVVGHRKKNLFERWWSGQTSAYLSDHIGCSLLIARRTVTDDEFRAAIDGAREDA
ncbi:MAG: universal stress protein [Ignavibacteriales bacterium]